MRTMLPTLTTLGRTRTVHAKTEGIGMKATRFFSALIVLAGLSLTGRALYLHAKAELAGLLIRRAWQQSLRSGEARPPWPWADTHPVARLRIPHLDYDEIVLEGAAPRTLAFGPAHLLSSSAFGEPGNLILAGHRTSWFQPLERISNGDTIEIEWFEPHHRDLRQRTYSVELIRVVDPQDTTLLAPTSEDKLTLITCYPFGSSPRSPQRFVVRASPVGSTRESRKLGVSIQDMTLAAALSAQSSRAMNFM
jgi:sortase A